MDTNTKKVFNKFFFENPTFFLEVSRIKCDVSQCVLPQQVLKEVVVKIYPSIANLFSDYVSRRISTKNFLLSLQDLKRQLSQEVLNSDLHLWCKMLELKIVPFISLINRVLSTPTLAPDVYFYVSTSLNKIKVMSNIEKKILNDKLDFIKGRRKLIEIEGRLLGYPECCIQNFIRSKESTPAESKLIIECIECGIFNVLLNSLEKSEVQPFYSFFTSNFYPCSIKCRKAIKIGKKLDECLDEYFLAFRIRTMINALYYLTTAYKSFKLSQGEYKEVIKDFFSDIDPKWLKFLEEIKDSIINLTEYTNVFICRILKNYKMYKESA